MEVTSRRDGCALLTKILLRRQLGACACQFPFNHEELLAIYVGPHSSLSENYRLAAKTPPPNRVTTSNSEALATKSLADFSHDAKLFSQLPGSALVASRLSC